MVRLILLTVTNLNDLINHTNFINLGNFINLINLINFFRSLCLLGCVGVSQSPCGIPRSGFITITIAAIIITITTLALIGCKRLSKFIFAKCKADAPSFRPIQESSDQSLGVQPASLFHWMTNTRHPLPVLPEYHKETCLLPRDPCSVLLPRCISG